MLARLLGHERLVLTTHIRPDGDALGSQLALARFLRKLGKEVAIINSDPPTYNLYWLPAVDEIQLFDGSLAQLETIAAADAIVVMDTNALDRLGRLSAIVRDSEADKLLIDHHTNPERWFDASYARDTASATGELVYELIVEHDADLIDAEIATTLYTAIMTDTGSFRYSSVTPRLHRVVADVLERGDISPDPIHVSIFDTRSRGALRLLGRALATLTVVHRGQIAYLVVSQRMVREAQSSLEETDGFVNYPLSIEGVKAAVLFSETDSGVKASFRSQGAFYVNEWARAFGGGGHRNASGAYLKRPLSEVVDAVIEAAPRFLDLSPGEDESVQDVSAEDAAYLASMMNRKAKLQEP